MLSFKQFVIEARDTHCSDKCCGSDVKREDCDCPPTCEHCNCNAVDEACWDTHKQVGMKKKGDKMVPDCVPKEDVDEGIVGSALSGVFKGAAKTVVGGTRLAGKGIRRASVAGRADAAEKKAKDGKIPTKPRLPKIKEEPKKMKKEEKSQKEIELEAELEKIRLEKEKLAKDVRELKNTIADSECMMC